MKYRVGAMILVALLTCIATSSLAQYKLDVAISSDDVTVHEESDTTLGDFYTMPCPLPSGMGASQIDRVFLELYVDVTPLQRGDYLDTTPVVIEVFAMPSEPTGSIQPASLELAGGVVRPVRVGSGRRVTLDITRIARSFAAGEVDNNGLIIGSLTGSRNGAFVVREDGFRSRARAQLRIYRRMD